MKYKNNLTLTNPRRVPFSLSNQFDDTFGLTDMVSDCKNAEDFCAAANKYDRFHLKWKIDKDSKNETRLTCKDTLGNIHYLIAYKEDSGLPEIPTGNMITELRSRGYSVSVDKPEKIISKKDLGKLFQEAADTDQDELDFYSQLVSAGITVRDVFEYAGPEQANAMFLFCHEHGLLNEDKETEYVYQMICNLLSINKNYEKYDFKLFDKIWIYTVEDCGRGVVIADDDEEAKEKVLNAYVSHYTEFDPEYATIQINKAVENNNVFSDCPYVIEVE